jgi:putative FmdB family regulatory protein
MPIYEFHCEKCERDSEILVRSSDWKGTTCPHCGSTRLNKKLSVFASAGAGSHDASSCGGGGGCCGGHCHGH